MKRSTRFLTITGVACSLIVLIAGAALIIGDKNGTAVLSRQNEASTKASQVKVAGITKDTQPNTKQEIPIMYSPSPIERFYNKTDTIGNAKKEIAFDPRIPIDKKLGKLNFEANLKNMYVGKNPEKGKRGIMLDYGEIKMTIEPSLGCADYDAQAKEKPNVVKRTELHGSPAIEIEQGFEDMFGPDGKTVIGQHHYPSVVGWYDNGIKYAVLSDTLHLSELKAFVETMFE